MVAGIEHPDEGKISGPGHMIKMRYSPLQGRILAAEEPDSPYHEAFRQGFSLEGRAVVALSLHSQLAPVCLAAKTLGGRSVRLVYVMTDGSALPLAVSRLVDQLRQGGCLEATITTGQSFGGDLETISLHSGLQAAAEVVKADLIIIGPGPGMAGTGTVLGHTGLEQGEAVNAIACLGGTPVPVPRISFRDPRPRHFGLSHHTLTALGLIALAPAAVPLPLLGREKESVVFKQLSMAGGMGRHQIFRVGPGLPVNRLVKDLLDMKWTTMGRGPEEEKEGVAACAAAAALALAIK